MHPERSQLTIAIPACERLDFFEEALQSALRQVSPCTVIVVDNASSHDGFRQMCEKHKVDNLIYYRFEERVPMFKNWNRCVALAKTPYVMILGDDDIIKPQFCCAFEEAIQRRQIDVFSGGIDLIGSGAASCSWKPETLEGEYSRLDLLRFAVRRGNLGFPTVAMAFRTDYRFFDECHGSNDWRMIYEGGGAAQFFSTPDVLVHYRKHEGADTTANSLKLVASYAYIWDGIAARKDLPFRDRLLARWQSIRMLATYHLHSPEQNAMESEGWTYHAWALTKDAALVRALCALKRIASCFRG